MAERLKAVDLKSIVLDTAGSNPAQLFILLADVIQLVKYLICN